MPRTVSLARRAKADFDTILHWQLQRGSGRTAIQRVRHIVAALERLADMPCLHPPGPHPGTRKAHVEGHRIIYSVTPDTGDNTTAGDVAVLAIFGPGPELR